MDFFQIAVREKKGGVLEAYPDFIVGRSEDLMVRGGKFYAIWDEEKGLWSTDIYNVQSIVDSRLKTFHDENKHVNIKYMRSFGTNGQTTFNKFMSQIGDNSHQLDETLTFLGTRVSKKDYVSKRLPYDLVPGDISAWDELVGTLYSPENRAKIEWFLGSIVSGDSKTNQKFVVLYGPPGAGKGTIINIVMSLFDSYVTTFDAKALGSNGNQFAASAFAGNPLVAIQHDGDLSRIEDNTTLNSIVSHEKMKMNEKYKASYDARINAALLMGTNKPVKITDAQSGLIRRLIDVHPTGEKLPPKKYHALMDKIHFELGAIADHCLRVYKKMGKNYYSNYQPLEMMFQTDVFFNYIETYYDVFSKQDGASVKQAWNLYKEYCEEAGISKERGALPLHRFRAELGNYFDKFHDRITLDGVIVRSYYQGFKAQPFKTPVDDEATTFMLRMEETTSLLNLELAEYPAQYAKANGSPSKYWDDRERDIAGVVKKPRPSQVVDTLLRDLDPTQEHYVKVPHNHIVIDFDLEDADGNKSLERNLEEAAKWPATYAELSRSGGGVHLHYYYDGDVERLDPLYALGIEIKRYSGNAALRRRLTRCNDVPIARINSGLPLKENIRVIEPGTMKSVKALRELIARNLRKEIHPGTKPSIDFIKKILDDAYESGMDFDVSDLKGKIVAFANNSSNRALECLNVVQSIRWKSEEDIPEEPPPATDERKAYVDVEVFPNLFVICWKFEEKDPAKDSVIQMINPPAHQVEALLGLKLVGFNTRNYDNHMIWAAALGYSNIQLYNLSKKIINNAPGSKFGEAYKISYMDPYDFSTKKQGLKKWQIELGLEHRELDLDWDQPVPEKLWPKVVEYCVNDVVSLELVDKHLEGDRNARLILSDLSGLTPNDTTAKHTAAIVFGGDKNPQKHFVYTRLAEEFPGYVYEAGKSTYRGDEVGEGGYVYAEPGLYRDVALLDVASMHPTSLGILNLFGDYTPRYMAIVEAQLAIKRRDYDTAKTLLDGKLRPYIEEIETLGRTDADAAKKAAADLRHGLKIAMNIVYGLTRAKFDNPFKDFNNVDNIVAKRGALFMIDLKNFIQEQGYRVVHIKTDSVKIVNANQEIIDAVKNFASKYGYTMEYNPETDQYAKLGLVNDAVYVAKKDECITNCWTATGTQYHAETNPYVFKTLFGYSDDISLLDLGVTKSVKDSKMYLDFGAHDVWKKNSDAVVKYHYDLEVNGTDNGEPELQPELGYIESALAEIKAAEKALKDEIKNRAKKASPTDVVFFDGEEKAIPLIEEAKKQYDEALKKLVHVGKTGRFTPVKPGYGGGQLWRIKDGKHYAIAGTKGYLWVDSAIAADLPDEAIDYGYFDRLVEEARANLEKFLDGSGFSSVDEFLS
jgi:hypothetical protein